MRTLGHQMPCDLLFSGLGGRSPMCSSPNGRAAKNSRSGGVYASAQPLRSSPAVRLIPQVCASRLIHAYPCSTRCPGQLTSSLTVADTRSVYVMTASATELTPVGVLAMSIRQLGRLPRSPWAADVLTEQLAAISPPRSSLRNVVDQLRSASSSRLLTAMAQRQVIDVLGIGATASYTIADNCMSAVETLEGTLTSDELRAVQRATQRANAIFAAWAKASVTWASSAEGNTVGCRTRRHSVR